MALKLFRSTGYSTLLLPGETRQAAHPAWLVVGASAWIALACNVGVWRLPFEPDSARAVLASVALLGGASGLILSLLAWRRTLRLAASVLLFVAALFACGTWVQNLPTDVAWQLRPRALLPAWPNFLQWQLPTLMLVLAIVPVVWVWNMRLRRLPGPDQLRSNILGCVVAALLFGAGLFLQH